MVKSKNRRVQKNFQIAIDGPVAAGKSTVAKMLAERLGFLYVDTGAMYRAVALEAKKQRVSWEDEEGVIELMNTLELELDKPNGNGESDGRLVTVLLDGEDVSQVIRTAELGEGASVVSTYGGVRQVLVAMQQNIARGANVVMEGRDIGLRVLPKAQLKIFLTAKPEERAKRKWEYFKDRGERRWLKKVKEEIEIRDEREMTREIDPLKPQSDSWVLDTTDMGIDKVVEMIIEKVQEVQQVRKVQKAKSSKGGKE